MNRLMLTMNPPLLPVEWQISRSFCLKNIFNFLHDFKARLMLEKRRYTSITVKYLKQGFSSLFNSWLPSIPKLSRLKTFSVVTLALLLLQLELFFKIYKKTSVILLCWFVTQQSSTLMRQFFYSKLNTMQNLMNLALASKCNWEWKLKKKQHKKQKTNNDNNNINFYITSYI